MNLIIVDNVLKKCEALSSSTCVVPDGVTSIGDYAFSCCKSLKEIIIPNSVTSIGEKAFWYCEALTKVVLSNSLQSIGASAFNECTSLTEIIIPESVESIGDNAFFWCGSLSRIVIEGNLRDVGNDVFSCISSEVSIDIGKNMTDIRAIPLSHISNITSDPENPTFTVVDNVLYNKDLTTLIRCGVEKEGEFAVPNSVTDICKGAFAYCKALTKVVLPESLLRIENWLFDGCTSLKEVVIPDSVNYIGTNAFRDCDNISSIYIGERITDITEIPLLQAANITVSPDNSAYTAIENALYNKDCTELIRCAVSKKGEFIIPDSVLRIKNRAFINCGDITSLIIPQGITIIPQAGFKNCQSLAEIVIPESVETICEWAFEGCENLHRIVIPNSLKRIMLAAFYGCNNISALVIGKSLSRIEELPLGNLEIITVSPGNDTFTSADNVLYNKDCTTLIRCGIGKAGEFIIPSSVVNIAKAAFWNCTQLTGIVIPDSVVDIGERAFGYCTALTKAVIPDSITTIRARTFYNCKNLADIVLPDTVENVFSSAFWDCSSLTNFKIPAGTERVDSYAHDDLYKSVRLTGRFTYSEVIGDLAARTDRCGEIRQIGAMQKMTCAGSIASFLPYHKRDIEDVAKGISLGIELASPNYYEIGLEFLKDKVPGYKPSMLGVAMTRIMLDGLHGEHIDYIISTVEEALDDSESKSELVKAVLAAEEIYNGVMKYRPVSKDPEKRKEQQRLYRRYITLAASSFYEGTQKNGYVSSNSPGLMREMAKKEPILRPIRWSQKHRDQLETAYAYYTENFEMIPEKYRSVWADLSKNEVVAFFVVSARETALRKLVDSIHN